MALNLLHQCGHNSNWNRESYLEDNCGDGLILSPVHQTKDNIESLDSRLKLVSSFDHQFYLPNSQKTKLKSYDFFPEVISGGFVTSGYTAIALDAARKCVDFQISNSFSRVIIPARHFSDMVPDYTDQQDRYSVHPFLQAIDESDFNDDVYLTLPVTKAMLANELYRTQLLNWVTSFPRIDGVYILVEDQRQTKQIQELQFIKNYLATIKELADAGLNILVGHTNTEGLLFSLIDKCEITFGAYENTRMFSTDKFVVSEEDRRGPSARLYMPGLLNWIRVSHASEIRSSMKTLWDEIYTATRYGEEVLDAAAEPHFNFPGLYKHYFISYSMQVEELKKCSIEARYNLLRSWLNNAEKYYDAINAVPIDLDTHGRGEHIDTWRQAVNWYYREYIA